MLVRCYKLPLLVHGAWRVAGACCTTGLLNMKVSVIIERAVLVCAQVSAEPAPPVVW
jgi:hypothetical protein